MRVRLQSVLVGGVALALGPLASGVQGEGTCTPMPGGRIVVPLVAGRTLGVGSVTVATDGTHLAVTYGTDAPWLLRRTHLYVGSTPPAKAAPGLFPFRHDAVSGTADQYVLALADAGLGSGDCAFFAAHAEVLERDGPTEGAWALGPTPLPRGWGWTFDGRVPAAAACDPAATPNAGLDEPEGIDGCPPGMGPIVEGGACIDLWEAHLVEVRADGTTVPFSPYVNPGSARVRAVSAPGAVPQAYIDGVGARAACAEAGKRLCTDQEWLAACRGPTNLTYPYGPQREPGRCNDDGVNDPESWRDPKEPCLNQKPGTLVRSGERAGCVSASGAFDLMGNLQEWTADPAGTLRGGFYADTRLNGEGCLYTTTAYSFLSWTFSTGFRCCGDIE